MEAVQRRAPANSGNRRMATINDMLDDITEEIFRTEPFDQQTEVLVDPSLNYGLDLYHVVTGNESFENRERVESDGLHFVDHIHENVNGVEHEEGEEENVITAEMKTFNKFFKEAVEDLKYPKKPDSQRPPLEERRTESQFTLRRIEAAFSESDKKIKLLENLKTIGTEKGWYKKIDNFTAKLMNDNIISGKDIHLQEYIEQVSEYGLKTMPRTMCDKIKSEVGEFVKQFTKPFDEIYKEAVAEAATVTPDELTKMRQFLIKTAPLKPEIVVVDRKAIAYEISTQTEPVNNEAGSQTIEGLGTFEDKDFESIVQNDSLEDVKMACQPTSEFHSEEEPGVMSKEDEEALITKLETEIEKQKRIREDMRKALNPKLGLHLHQQYPDHRPLIKKLKEMTEFGAKVFEESFAAQKDKTLPPPEILTLKWNEKIYKFVTTFTWTYPTIDETLPPEKRRMRVQKNENIYLYIPPPTPESSRKRPPADMSDFECLFPKIKRRFGILEEYPLSSKQKMELERRRRRPKYTLYQRMIHNCPNPSSKIYTWDENNRRTQVEGEWYSDSDVSDSESDSDSSDNESNVDVDGISEDGRKELQLRPISDYDTDFDDDEDDDNQSSMDSTESSGRKRRRKTADKNQASTDSQAAKETQQKEKVTVETQIMEVQEDNDATPETTVIQEVNQESPQEDDGENSYYNGIESCDEEDLWDDFIPERVFAEKCPFKNTFVDEF